MLFVLPFLLRSVCLLPAVSKHCKKKCANKCTQDDQGQEEKLLTLVNDVKTDKKSFSFLVTGNSKFIKVKCTATDAVMHNIIWFINSSNIIKKIHLHSSFLP